jgi:uncharacterized protein (TIGR02271 family)
MPNHLQGVPVVRSDGVAGKVASHTTNADGSTMLFVQFEDGAQLAVAPDMLAVQADGAYRLDLSAGRLAPEDEIVIPVIAEEILVGKQQVTRGVVRVHKRVETQEKVVDAPISAEEIVVERLPIHAFVDGAPPQIREEDGVVIIPVLEEVLVVEKRLFLREEVHLTRQVTTSTVPQTVLVRHEVVEIERVAADGTDGRIAGDEPRPAAA